MRNVKKLSIVTTVPETISSILKGQPKYLSKYFSVSLVTSPDKSVKDIESCEEVEVQLVPMKRGISPYQDLISIFRMWRKFREIRPDIVQSYTPKAGLVAMLAAKVAGVPVRIHTFTGLIFPTATGFKQKILIWVDRLICGCATHIVPEGMGVKNDLEKYEITKKPLKIIGYGNIAGVDTNYFYADDPSVIDEAILLREKLNTDPRSINFCFVGRLNKDKGISELVDAFELLPDAANLILVGGLDTSAPISDKTIDKIEHNSRIHSLGFQRDIRPALKLADFLVLPSYREGFPNVVLQAGAMALPVIATDINGCNEAIEPGFNGWLVPPRSSDSLLLAMQNAMQISKDFRREMGDNARTRIQQRYERQNHWDRMLNFYLALCDKNIFHKD